MPTKNERVMLTVKPATLAAVRSVAEASNIPAASLIAQMLDEMVPMLNSMAAAAKATKEKRVEAFDNLAESLGVAQVSAAKNNLGCHGRAGELREQRARRPASPVRASSQ